MKVSKWGDSLAIRIPDDVAEALGLSLGDDVELMSLGDGRLGVTTDQRREQAVAALRSLRGSLPADYRFSRDEANAR